MKVLLIIIVVILILVAIPFVLVTPQVKRLSICLEEGNKGLDNNIKTATVERWNKEKVCMNGKPVMNNMKNCYSKAEKDTLIPVVVVENLAKIIKPNVSTLSKVISIHNNACASYPQYQVRF